MEARPGKYDDTSDDHRHHHLCIAMVIIIIIILLLPLLMIIQATKAGGASGNGSAPGKINQALIRAQGLVYYYMPSENMMMMPSEPRI